MQYYAEFSAAAEVVISLPKGGYAASIEVKRPSSRDAVAQLLPFRFPLWGGALALGGVALAVVTVVGVAPRSKRGGVNSAPEAVTQTTNLFAPAIAVLPFDNMSADPDQEYFSDGITEDIITDLSVLPDLAVIARNSTFVYKNRPTSIRVIADDLGVSHVLEGSVRRDGDMVRITAQLIDVETEAHIWAGRYDRAIDDVFEIQEAVSREIVAALELALPVKDSAIVTGAHRPNLLAHDAFLRGKEQFYRYDEEGVLGAIDLFAAAIDQDADFAEAYAWKSRALIFAFISGFNSSKDETVGQALLFAERAIELDRLLPSANANLAWAKRWNQEFAHAEALINRAIDLDPNSADAYLWKSLILSTVGKGDEALDAIERSNRLNPNYGATSIFALGRAQLQRGAVDEAIAIFDRGINRNPNFLPNHMFKLLALEKTGALDRAIAAKAMMAQINPNFEQSAAYQNYLAERQKP